MTTNGPIGKPKILNGSGSVFIPILQTLILLACIASVTVLGESGVIDAPAITAIIGAIVGSVGVLAAVNMGTRRNGRGEV